MGLDVSAYKNVKRLESFEADEYGEPKDVETVQVSIAGFKERAGNIVDGYYTYEDEYGFRVGSYSGYNNWRNELARLAGYKITKYTEMGQERECYAAGAWQSGSGAFWELINFSDCEGVLGTEVCKKLLADFIEYDERAKTFDSDFYERYKEWTEGMKYAAENGLFDFH